MNLPNKNLTYPRVMMVSDEPITKDNPGEKRVVWAYNPRLYFAYRVYASNIVSLENLEDRFLETIDGEGGDDAAAIGFSYAQDYQETKIELTLDEIANKFGINVNQLNIKK